jgi:putative transposase
MGSVGDAYDNPMVENFFASLEGELINQRSWKTKTENLNHVQEHATL